MYSSESVAMLIFINVDIFKHTAKKIRKLNEQIKFYLKCMVPPEFSFMCIGGSAFLLMCGKHMYHCIILLGGEVWVYDTSLTLPPLIEELVPNQEDEW